MFWAKKPAVSGNAARGDGVCPKYSSLFENDTLQVTFIATSAPSVGQRGHVLRQTRYGFSALPNKLF